MILGKGVLGVEVEWRIGLVLGAAAERRVSMTTINQMVRLLGVAIVAINL